MNHCTDRCNFPEKHAETPSISRCMQRYCKANLMTNLTNRSTFLEKRTETLPKSCNAQKSCKAVLKIKLEKTRNFLQGNTETQSHNLSAWRLYKFVLQVKLASGCKVLEKDAETFPGICHTQRSCEVVFRTIRTNSSNFLEKTTKPLGCFKRGGLKQVKLTSRHNFLEKDAETLPNSCCAKKSCKVLLKIKTTHQSKFLDQKTETLPNKDCTIAGNTRVTTLARKWGPVNCVRSMRAYLHKATARAAKVREAAPRVPMKTALRKNEPNTFASANPSTTLTQD